MSPRRKDYASNETRSEAYIPVTNGFRSRKEKDDLSRSKDHHHIPLLPTKRLSPKARRSNNKFLNELSGELEREKLIEAEVYRDNYIKLKQKYLKM